MLPGIGPERWWRKLNNTCLPLRASHPRTKRPTIPWILFRQPYRVRWSLPPGNCLAVAAGNRSLPPILKMNGGRAEARRQAQAWLSPLESHLTEGGLGHVSEIFEGDAPHRPCGCIAQAWSVAEILRVYSEELRGLWPNTPPCAHPA
jgi:hypothetical protein